MRGLATTTVRAAGVLAALSCVGCGVPLVGADAPGPSAAAQPTCHFVAASYSLRHRPGGCWRPYRDASPFNRPIPRDAPDARGSAAMVRRTTGWGPPQNLLAGTAGTREDWSHPTYYARRRDPVYRLHCRRRWGRCPVEGHRIRVPAAARPAAGSDGHLAVVDPRTRWEYDLWRVRRKGRHGGRLVAAWGGRTLIGGSGLGSAATAAGYGNLAGIIRAPELARGQIDHALFMTVPCDGGRPVPPAVKAARSCASLGRRSAADPPMGAHFQLRMSSDEIARLRVPPWKRTILRAMATYGMYLGDTGGSSWTVQFESGATYTSFGQPDAMVAFARRAGVPHVRGRWVFDLAGGVDWGGRLRVVDPCAALGRCRPR